MKWTYTNAVRMQYKTCTVELAMTCSSCHTCVTHSHRWPDFGIPSSPLPLRRLAHLLDESDNPQAGSPVVHCSAGIGRTGTFVAIDVVLKRLRSLDGKDIKGELLSLLLQSHLSG